MKRNNGLNILKCIACFGVVWTHFPFPGGLGSIISSMAFVALPVFFMIAGYYSLGCTEAKIKKRLIKIVKLLLLALFWFLVWEIFNQTQNHTLQSWLADNLNWKVPVRCFVFCTIIWAVPLWYLIAMAETYVLWFFVVKKKMEDIATKFTWILLIMGIILTIVVFSVGLDWSFQINFVCRALPWFMLGYLIHQKYELRCQSVKNLTLFLIACVGWIIMLSGQFINAAIKYEQVGVLLTAPSLFLLAIKNPNVAIWKPIEYIAEKLSPFIYIFHPLVSYVIRYGMKVFGFTGEGIYTYFHPIITLFASILVAIVCEKAHVLSGGKSINQKNVN